MRNFKEIHFFLIKEYTLFLEISLWLLLLPNHIKVIESPDFLEFSQFTYKLQIFKTI